MSLPLFARFAAVLTFVASAAGVSTVHAQTSLGWGQHVSRYGSGYVGNAPNTLPATAYYRAPAITAYNTAGYAPLATTAYYAPGAPAPMANTGYYSPSVSYRVGTPNAAAYTTAYSPIVAPSTPYSATWQYPPQTIMPSTGNFLPAPPAYTTNYAQVPVTTYRPVTVLSPTGVPQTVLQPCTGYECQAQRQQAGFFGWLFHHNKTPTTAGYPCAGGACGAQPAPLSVPYYTPGPATTVAPLAPTVNSGVSVPANTVPSLSGPPVITTPSTPSTISSPAIGAGSTITPIAPGTELGGHRRADYPPPPDAYCPPTTGSTTVSPSTSFSPNVSPGTTQVVPLAPIGPPSTNGQPADAAPSLIGPSNGPIGNGLAPEAAAPLDSGARVPARPQYNVETQMPRATLRRDSSITPIPDPEANSNRVPAKANKAPQLLTPSRDRTAAVTAEVDARLASFEQNVAPVKPAAPVNSQKIIGDDAWRSVK